MVSDMEYTALDGAGQPFMIVRDGGLEDARTVLVDRAEVGGKAAGCFELMQSGRSVPEALVLPASIYDAHIEALGLGEQIDDVLSKSDGLNIDGRLSCISATLLEARLDRRILNLISSTILKRHVRLAVRSSAVLEDMRQASTASQFATILNCSCLDDVEQAILRCWASLWQPAAFRYCKQHYTDTGSFAMAVLLMPMINARASGVLFTRDPVYGQDNIVIEAIWGLGEGLVSRGLSPDRIIYDKRSGKYSTTVADKVEQYEVCTESGQIVSIPVPDEMRLTHVLTDQQIKHLVSDVYADSEDNDQNFEWVIDRDGRLWYLQARPITSGGAVLPAFIPPAAGKWGVIDHFTRPNTRCCAEYYYEAMEDAWNQSAAEIGLINRVKIREINRFMYYQMGTLESAEKFSQMAKISADYWEKKDYLRALSNWDESIKPDAVFKLKALQSIALSELTDQELVSHVIKCFAVAREMTFVHHLFTYTALIPLGDFINSVIEWTGLAPLEILTLVDSMDPNRRSLVRHRGDVVPEMLEEFRRDPVAMNLLTKAVENPILSGNILNELMAGGGVIQTGLRTFLDTWGHRIVEGYDIADEIYLERPDLMLSALRALVKMDVDEDTTSVDAQERVRSQVPTDLQALFDEKFDDILAINRLRQERGLFSDLWAVGILRCAYLEAGRRLAARRAIDSADLVLEASPSELNSLFEGRGTVDSEELVLRKTYRRAFTVKDAPLSIGVSVAPPNLSALPPEMVRTMSALMTAVSLAVDPTQTEISYDLSGVAASVGQADGIIRVIRSVCDFSQIEYGDIAVVRQATASLNAVMPILGGIITEYGGILSHQAILAREFGIPCIVACVGVMEKLRTGMRVHLNGTKGTIEINSATDSMPDKLKRLQCDYRSILKGRNRSRALNHSEGVRRRLALVREAEKSDHVIELLEDHFYGRLGTAEALQNLKGLMVNLGKGDLTDLVQRDLVEFHASDNCNLRCRGCTYFQDNRNKRPEPISFPFASLASLMSLVRPKAITIVGGGEPTRFKSAGQRLGDMIVALGSGKFGPPPNLGIISNGVLWPPGNEEWHRYVDWFRVSLDCSCEESYFRAKGKAFFTNVVDNVFRLLRDTEIAQVGVGFLYHPNNLREIGALLSLFGERMMGEYREYLPRFNIQFRPWRSPFGRPAINEHIITRQEAMETYRDITNRIAFLPDLEEFVRNHTNIAVNLMVRGAREQIEQFPECYLGLAKTVVRADGSLYPCFRVAAHNRAEFCAGNLISDSVDTIALRHLYIHMHSVKQQCLPEPEKCLFAVFNNLFDSSIAEHACADPEVQGDYFF